MKAKRLILWIVLAVLLVALLPPAFRAFSRARRRLAADRLYEKAIGHYMLERVDESLATFKEIASRYADLPLGALAQLKIAFLTYDQWHNLDKAESLFREFLDKHPDGVMYLSEVSLPDYDGELELVAYYFLGRIASDRGRPDEARAWFDKILARGSANPANMIVGETTVLVRQMDEAARKQGGSG
ncbi:MAG: tetratricopeptide repeat protein [Planctomycetota bacterium]